MCCCLGGRTQENPGLRACHAKSKNAEKGQDKIENKKLITGDIRSDTKQKVW